MSSANDLSVTFPLKLRFDGSGYYYPVMQTSYTRYLAAQFTVLAQKCCLIDLAMYVRIYIIVRQKEYMCRIGVEPGFKSNLPFMKVFSINRKIGIFALNCIDNMTIASAVEIALIVELDRFNIDASKVYLKLCML